ncbi:hypothetical protein LUQ84_001536 [Hamiltosporidium tvaerminnensis]|nr:hypothetical protein LUQ84_001536 [Hamiltosporidium tvaerminnensis]
MEFNLFFRFIKSFYKPIILVFIYHSSERDIIFNVVNENEEFSIASTIKKIKLECLCRIKRDEMNENEGKMLVRDSNRQYEQYYIEFIERIGLRFDIFEKFNKMNNNIEIYLCHHIKKSDFLIFYEFIISYYLPVHKMTIKKFYTILYFLEYFRVEYDNKLRKVIKNIWCSLIESNEIINFDIEKVSFHFSKQDYFSHDLFKRISKGYFELLTYRMDESELFFRKEHESYIYEEYKGLYTEDKKHTLVINDEFDTFFYKKVVVNHKSQSLFLIFLNTLDIKYLHIKYLNVFYSESFCNILENLKRMIDEIVFFKCYIYDKVIRSLNANINFVNLKKIVFIKCKFDTIFIFTEHLSNIQEFIFYENNNYEIYRVPEIKEGNLNIAEYIIKSLKHPDQQFSIEEFLKKNKNVPKENENFYLKLLNEDNFKGKVGIITYFECKNYNLQVKCFYEYKGSFNNISITLKKLNKRSFFTTENTILEKNIKCIEISSSEIKSDFLRDILNIKGLERLEIEFSNIYIENEIFTNESINYFSFTPKNSDSFRIFFKLIYMMIDLQEIYVYAINTWKLTRFVNRIFYIKELTLRNTHEMIDLLKLSENNKNIALKITNKDISDSEYPKDSLKFLFQNYDLSSIMKLSIRNFLIDNLDVKAFSNLSNLKEFKVFRINFQNIGFSELFCNSREYKIKRMDLDEINISEKDLIFIANLKKIEKIIFRNFNIQRKTYNCIQMLFNNEVYIELKYYKIFDYLSEETIDFIEEAFKTKYIVIRNGVSGL